MLVSLKTLRQYVSLDGLSEFEIAKGLTFAGVEVEEISRMASGTNLVIGEVDHMKLDANGGGGLSCRVRREKRCCERHPLHLCASIAQYADGELRVESAGKKRQSPRFFGIIFRCHDGDFTRSSGFWQSE